MSTLDPADSRPPYRQLVDALRLELASGAYTPGARFPSHGETAARFDVSVGTVKRAYSALQDEGLIVTRQGQGSFVRSKPPAEQLDLRAAVEDLQRRMDSVERQLGAQASQT